MSQTTPSAQQLERKSCAVTLSDMEVFIFPELIYSLVLANIMSPRIWKWREDSWFRGIERMKPYRRITRVKQFIMDHYQFNLDLDTWGLTTRETELARFSSFIDEETLSSSNALFGYEGDRYYFDIDIRTHFGLNKYEGNIIPYWKTETVEAMDAFRFKPDYGTGAGECVSLATLYAAALFIVGGIPLRDIFLMATPLHSQNLVDVDDGILTNNRRLVTKKMWFNGTALSAQARRALENERVTIVAHESGVIHTLYDRATIEPAAYARFSDRLQNFLKAPIDAELIGSFLRHQQDIQRCFQLRVLRHGVDAFVPMERVMAYELNSPFRMTDHTREKLMDEMDPDEFHSEALPSRIVFNDLEQFSRENRIDIHDRADVERLKQQFASDCLNAEMAIEGLVQFSHTKPRLPNAPDKTFSADQSPLALESDMSREDVIERLRSIRDDNDMAHLAFYAYRDLGVVEPGPYLKACFERNPVCVQACSHLDDAELIACLQNLPGDSIYDEDGRLAQPDEVWNFGRGDGVEKAVLAGAVLRSRRPAADITLRVSARAVELQVEGQKYAFESAKNLPDAEWAAP